MDLGDIEKPRETLNECQHHLDLLRGFQGTAGWDLLCRYFDDSAGHIERAVLGVPSRPDSLYEQEFRKGQAATLRHIRNYVSEYCETLEDNIKRIIDLMRIDEEEEANAGHDLFAYRASQSVNGTESESESHPIVP